MDCKTARLLLEFHRAHAGAAGELDGAEAAALDEHLASCPECEVAARAEQRADEVLGRAMRRVEVPDRLRARLVARLAADRRAGAVHYLARLPRRARLAAAAAAALLVGVLGYGWLANRLNMVDAAKLEVYWEEVKADQFSRRDADTVRLKFREMGVETVVPRQFRYQYLASYGLGYFQGQTVPQMVFIRDGEAQSRPAYATVLILSPRQFNLDQLNGNWQSEDGYPYHVRAVRYPGSPQVYVVFYTGDGLDWLQEHDEAAL